MCPACRREYADPRDRRFHAEPNACPACGPRLRAASMPKGVPLAAGDPIAATLARLRAARSSPSRAWAASTSPAMRATPPRWRALRAAQAARGEALRGDGRQRSPRVAPLAEVGAARARRCCESRERPIVLLRKRAGGDDALPGVAPGLRLAGRDAALHAAAVPAVPRGGGPAGRHRAGSSGAQPLVLVMTSANPGGEPLVTGNDEALARLAGIADACLVHDRDIVDPLRRQRAARVPTRRPAPRSSSAARAATRRGPIKLPRAGPVGAGARRLASRTRSA